MKRDICQIEVFANSVLSTQWIVISAQLSISIQTSAWISAGQITKARDNTRYRKCSDINYWNIQGTVKFDLRAIDE